VGDLASADPEYCPYNPLQVDRLYCYHLSGSAHSHLSEIETKYEGRKKERKEEEAMLHHNFHFINCKL
jgi:hypothetical protein